jgi:hypothetical protein
VLLVLLPLLLLLLLPLPPPLLLPLQVFFSSWLGYPILFMLGQEGFFSWLSPWGSVVGHCIVDVLSKNVGGHTYCIAWLTRKPVAGLFGADLLGVWWAIALWTSSATRRCTQW